MNKDETIASNYFIEMFEKEMEFINSLDSPLFQMGISNSLSEEKWIRTYEQVKGL